MKSLLAAAAVALFSATLAIGLDREYFRLARPRVAVAIVPSADDNFRVLGRAYVAKLGGAYAQGWDEGATQLEAGVAVSKALAAVGSTWTTARTALYDATITPQLAKILPESTDDDDVTPAERAALAAAFRGLARGLSP
jgi:hypothetical protein